jgi:GR25 family glycosyltransferase involved in LPS biosynthesis
METAQSIMSQWYHVPTVMTFLFMVLSPSKFFKKFDTIFFDEFVDEDDVVGFSKTEIIAKGDTMQEIERDEQVLNNLKRMVDTATTPEAKQLWSVKKAEFERQLRWKRHTYYN